MVLFQGIYRGYSIYFRETIGLRVGRVCGLGPLENIATWLVLGLYKVSR